MKIFSVGRECPFKVVSPVSTLMDQGDIYLAVCSDNIKQIEADDFQFGDWWFSLRKEQDHIVLLAKNRGKHTGNTSIYEFIFSLNKISKKAQEKFLILEDGEAFPILLLLVDKGTSITRGQRMFGLSCVANQFMKSVFIEQSKKEPNVFDVNKLPSSIRKSFDMGFIKEKSGTK